ncbi:MAG: hypothetical protein H6584_06180 [Flavobacteriales bacterium]|nr:hypothetical protein [Flavobacteriales bacterium]
MEHITLKIKDQSKFKTLLKFLKTLDFVSVVEKDSSPYNPEFVKKIQKSVKQMEEGQVTRIDNISDFLGIE